jgi:hypothetical protein
VFDIRPQAEAAPRVLLSHLLLQEGKDWAAAEQALREILDIDPNFAEAEHNLQVLARINGSGGCHAFAGSLQNVNGVQEHRESMLGSERVASPHAFAVSSPVTSSLQTSRESMAPSTKISLCMIVKDEEALPRLRIVFDKSHTSKYDIAGFQSDSGRFFFLESIRGFRQGSGGWCGQATSCHKLGRQGAFLPLG